MRTVKRHGCVVVPNCPHRSQVVVGTAGAFGQGDTNRIQLRFEIADTDAEHEAATAEHIKAGDLFRQHQRISLRENDDARTEQHAVCRTGNERQMHQRVEDDVGWFHRRRRHPRRWQHHVLTDPPAFVTQFLASFGQPRGGCRAAGCFAVETENAELHSLSDATAPTATPHPVQSTRRSRRR